MYLPAVLKLQSVTENAIDRLDIDVLPPFVKLYIEGAECNVFDLGSSSYTLRVSTSRHGSGRAQFALAILAALLDALPECYHTRVFLFVRL
jgi:hypothetical protein